MPTLDEDIKTDELDTLAAERGYWYRIRPMGSLTDTLKTYVWEAHPYGGHDASGGAFSLEEAIEKVTAVVEKKVYYNSEVLGTLITRKEFIKLDLGEVYDNLTCCGAKAVIFRHKAGHVAVEDSNSVSVPHKPQEPQRPSRGLFDRSQIKGGVQ
jgi:hypothetical protein